MTWNTHITVGLNSLWLTSLFPIAPEKYFILIPLAALASLLPDIDASSAKIHYVGGGALRMFSGKYYSGYFQHRGIMHSLFATLIIFFITTVIFREFAMALTLAVAYLSHPIIDGFNIKGVGYLFPFKLKHYSLLPKTLLTKYNRGGGDKLLFILGAFGIAVFLLLVLPQLIPTPANTLQNHTL